MKLITKLTTTAILILWINAAAIAQTPEEMKAMQDYMTPGDIHKMIAKSEGKWTGDISLWMQPGTDPIKNTATCVNRMILGGRYLEGKNTGAFMGMPFEGISTLAYDNGRKIFMSTWVDNMGTGIMYLEGTWDNGAKAINFKGKATDPTTGKPIDVREVYTLVDDNTQKLEMFMTPEGKQEMKSMEVIYKRAK